jgi:hypothetical protein
MRAKLAILGESHFFISLLRQNHVPKHEIATHAFFCGREVKIQGQAAPWADAEDPFLARPVDMGPKARARSVDAKDVRRHLTGTQCWNHNAEGPRAVEVLLQAAARKDSIGKRVAEMRDSIQVWAATVAAQRTNRGPNGDHICVVRNAAGGLDSKGGRYRGTARLRIQVAANPDTSAGSRDQVRQARSREHVFDSAAAPPGDHLCGTWGGDRRRHALYYPPLGALINDFDTGRAKSGMNSPTVSAI